MLIQNDQRKARHYTVVDAKAKDRNGKPVRHSLHMRGFETAEVKDPAVAKAFLKVGVMTVKNKVTGVETEVPLLKDVTPRASRKTKTAAPAKMATPDPLK